MSVAISILDIDLNSGIEIGSVLGSLTFVVNKFLNENKRTPTAKEKIKLVWLSLFIYWIVILIISGISLFFGAKDTIFELANFENWAIILGSFIAMSILLLGVFYFEYGFIANRQFKKNDKNQ